MRAFRLVAYAVLAMAMGSKIASAQDSAEPTVLTPASPWSLDYAETQCSLFRSYRNGERKVFVEFRQSGLGHNVKLFVVSQDFERSREGPIVSFLPEETGREFGRKSFIETPVGDGFVVLTSLIPYTAERREAIRRNQFDAIPDDWTDEARNAREAAISGILIERAFEVPLLIEPGDLHAPMQALRACVLDLYASWGIDVSLREAVAERASRKNFADWARKTQEDYPSSMARQGKGAVVTVTVVVGVDGKLTSCHADNVGGEPVFEKVVCDSLMEHATYEPARDADGNRVPDIDSLTVVYSLK